MAKRTRTTKTNRGPRGPRGFAGVPGIKPATLSRLTSTLESLQVDAQIQFKRIAQLQVQLDATLKALNEMGEKVGRHRKKR